MYQSYISALSTSTSLTDICKIGNQVCSQYGFDYFAYSMRIPLSVKMPQYLVMESNPRCNRSTAIRLRSTVPFLSGQIDGNIPINWNNCKTVDAGSQRITELLHNAAEQGYQNGLTIPLHSHHSGSAMYTCGSKQPGDNVTELIDTVTPELHLIASYLHEAIARHVNYAAYTSLTGEIRISKRETECLQWAAEGLTTLDIASLLNISESTVTFHFQNSMIKLDASNRQQAVARAIMLGLI